MRVRPQYAVCLCKPAEVKQIQLSTTHRLSEATQWGGTVFTPLEGILSVSAPADAEELLA